MRINHNVAAMNTHRQMGISESDGSRSMEKLSSGFRINRAGDDAAGLAISEKMRAQIRGLNMASKNSSDTISLIQTAEGALGETHSILQRIRELAVQSANDTNTNADRDELQSEVKQLKAEIDRIGNTTEFNTKKLLEGSAKGVADEILGTSRINNNSSLLLDAGKITKMGESIGADKSWAFDGAYMLVRTNKEASGEYNPSNFMLVGPDGTQYKFVTPSSNTKVTESELKAGTIIAEGSGDEKTTVVGALNIAGNYGTGTTSITLGKALTEAEVTNVGANSVLASGSTFTLADTKSLTVNGAAVKWDSTKLTVGTVEVAANKSITLGDGTVLKNTGGGTVSVESGSILIGAATAVGSSADVTAVNIATQSVLTGSTVVAADKQITTASNYQLSGSGPSTITNNITLGNNVNLKNDQVTKLAEGSILAKGSNIAFGTGTNTVKIEVSGKELEMSYDATLGILKVGGEVVAAGKSITLEDGTVLTHTATLGSTASTGLVSVEQGRVKLAQDVTPSATSIKSYSVAKDSTLASGSILAAGTNLMAGTVISSPETFMAGSITLASGGKNLQFSANSANALAADYDKAAVGDSVTFIFSDYQAPSSKLNDSVMAQIGANSGQTAFVSIGDMRAKALGVADVDVSTKWGAATAIETVNNALQKVSHQRSSLGAIQNRLEHTIKNLDTAAENLQAAESRIRDVDMAKEIMEFTKNNILQQASQAMLAQANSQPQSVLSLLK